MLWAVQSETLPSGSLPIIASKRRSSSGSSPGLGVPWAGTSSGAAVVDGTVTLRFPEMLGVPPGFEIRRMSILLSSWLSGPAMYPAPTFGSMSVAGCGESGPGPEPETRLRKAVTTIGPVSRTLDLRIT